MTELENKEASGDKRLVLAFDAGCMACSELARRVEERVGDKLEIRNLRDLRVGEWCKRTLGEDAPWAPTLIEVKGLKIRAWTGKRMGLHLSRSLGPVATWQVMQILGELGAAAKAEEESAIGALVGGMNRAQFFKGLGGAVVAMSVLSGTGPLASTAFAAKHKKGTEKEQKEAEQIVRSSEQFKNLEREQEREAGNSGNKHDSWFDFDRAKVGVDKKGIAYVGVQTYDNHKRGVLAIFVVSLSRRNVVSHHHQVFARTDDNRRISFTHFNNSRPEQPYHQVFLESDGNRAYVVTEDGQKMSPEQFRDAFKRAAQGQQQASPRQQASPQQQATTQEYDSCQDCQNAEELDCTEKFDAFCGAIGFASLFTGTFAIPLGAAVIVSCAAVDFAGCPGAAEDACTSEGYC